MPLKFVEFSEAGSFISVNRGHLLVKKDNLEKNIPFDLISGVIFSGYGQTITTNTIERLLDCKSIIIFCNQKHMPESFVLPYSSNVNFMRVMDSQMNLKEVLKKSLWQKVIQYKVFNQGSVLEALFQDDSSLVAFSKNIKTFDKNNDEAKAARIYWPKLLGKEFIRSNHIDLRNGLLNYGYMVLRAIVARQVVISGLFPMFSLKHSNKENTYPLVDDLMEPFRPLVDLLIYYYSKKVNVSLVVGKEFKFLFFGFLNVDIPCEKGNYQLQTLIEKYIYSYVEALDKPLIDHFYFIRILWSDYAKRISDYVARSNI